MDSLQIQKLPDLYCIQLLKCIDYFKDKAMAYILCCIKHRETGLINFLNLLIAHPRINSYEYSGMRYR